jgi:hypothetical protein
MRSANGEIEMIEDLPSWRSTVSTCRLSRAGGQGRSLLTGRKARQLHDLLERHKARGCRTRQRADDRHATEAAFPDA